MKSDKDFKKMLLKYQRKLVSLQLNVEKSQKMISELRVDIYDEYVGRGDK